MKDVVRLFQYIRPYKKIVGLSIICNILLSVFTVVSIPLVIPFFQILFDRQPPILIKPESQNIAEWLEYFFSSLIANNDKEKALLLVCGCIVVVFFFKNVFRYLALFFMAPVRNGVVCDIRSQLFQKYNQLPLSFYSEEKKGDLISRMIADVQEIEWSILNVIEAIFKSPLIIIGSVALMLYISPSLTQFVLILIIFTSVIIGTIGRSLKKSSMEAQESLGRMSSIAEEAIGGQKIIKAYGAQNYQQKKFDKENFNYRNVLTRLLWRRDSSSPLTEFLGVTVVAVLLWYGSSLVFKSELAPETFFAFIFAFYQVIEPSKSFASAYYNIQKGVAAMERVEVMINTKINEQEQPGIYKRNFNNRIEFQNVSFKYEEDQELIIKNLNFSLQKGEKVAIVGASGAGKTTLIDLLMGFYKPTEGKIVIDDVEIDHIDKTDRASLFGLVTQHPILFNDTVENNIKFGREGKNLKDVIEAAKIAQADEFIVKLSDQYNTNIGDAGVKLSGGQQQRLTIARAILDNPPVLILDEATSALDSASELLVQAALELVLQERTAIIIAHRLSTVKNVTKIIVMKNGVIVEVGTHNELLNVGGEYKKYIEMQTFTD